MPEVQFLFLEMACKASARATHWVLPCAFTNMVYVYAVIFVPGEVGMLHSSLSTGVKHSVSVLYLFLSVFVSLFVSESAILCQSRSGDRFFFE